jgi:processive 1,2-diacylglycerol beta-glucosyltransferase
MKIVILTSNFGNGHNSVAQSLENELSKNHEVYIANPHDMNIGMKKIFIRMGESLYNDFISKSTKNPFFSNAYHYAFKSASRFDLIDNYTKSYGRRGIKNIITEVNPDIVISVFPYKVKTDKHVKVYEVITDYRFEGVWYDNTVDEYFVPNQEVATQLIKTGVNPLTVHNTGIPIKKDFFMESPFGHASCKNVLLTLGAHGKVNLDYLDNLIGVCILAGVNLEVVCGNNKKIEKYLRDKHNHKNIMIHGFVTNMPEILERSNLIITKAGGISISEAIASETPLLVNTTRSIKGQELSNIDFVARNMIGVCAKEKAIVKNLINIINNDVVYDDLLLNIKKIKESTYANDIFEIINANTAEEIHENF